MSRHSIRAIYGFEMARFRRTLWQSLVTPVITTSLYFVVFGAAIGSRMSEIGGVPFQVYGQLMNEDYSFFTSSGSSQRHSFIFSAFSESPQRRTFFSGRLVNGQQSTLSFFSSAKISSRWWGRKPSLSFAT